MMKCFLTKILAIVAISLSVSGCIITSGSGTEEEKGIVGCWKLETFAGFQADTDVYIVFNADNSFTLYQRSDNHNYTAFIGSYNMDKATSIISGVYSNGTEWAHEYKILTLDAKSLVWENCDNPAEVSEYSRSKAPQYVANNRAGSVKPFL